MRLPKLIGLCTLLLSAAPAHAQTWVLSTQPILSIGENAATPEYEFNRIEHLRRLSNGRILVTMGPDIRYFDAAGIYAGKAGGLGQGPGEFRYIRDLYVLPGDTLLALNIRHKVWLTGAGGFIRQDVIVLDALMKDGWFSEGAQLLPNGNLLTQQYREETEQEMRDAGLRRPVIRYTVLRMPSGTIAPMFTSGGLRQMRAGNVQPFSPHPQHAIGSEFIFLGDNDTTFASTYTLDGVRIATFPVADAAIAVTARDLDEYRQRQLDAIGNDQERKTRFLTGWDAILKPKRFPYWGSAIIDRTGAVWVSGPATYKQQPVVWRVFDRRGRALARVTLPPGFGPKEIGADYILGVARDDLGVETIRMYRLNRTPPG
ncbi:MAG TPA: hypothetical protein VJR92_06035 [Gemmatimonadaceae bacterium]|nr:hypothetical protein [Gemmatimonadaceae bacterium]